jgi:ABC-type amino acid transport substrate-binding protein
MPLRTLILILVCLPLFAQPLRAGTLDIPPYGLVDAQGAPDGVLYQLTNRVMQLAGLPYVNRLYPTARLYALLAHRDLDLAISSRQLDRDMGLVKLGKVWQIEGMLLYRPDLPVHPHALDDFSPYLIGRLTGTCPTLTRAGMHMTDLADIEQGLRMLAANRIDAICGERGGLHYAMRHSTEGEIIAAQTFTFLRSDAWLFANPKLAPATLEKLRVALGDMMQSGEADKLVARYIKPSEPNGSANPR